MQFGFKKNVGCSNALFVMSETIKHFTNNGSNVFGATLDLKKAFDKVNHFKLFTSLVKAGLPVWVVKVLVDWYSKLHVAVRWKDSLSYAIHVKSGVRQAGSLSPRTV